MHFSNAGKYTVRRFIEGWVFIATTIFMVGYFIFPTTSKQNTFFYVGVCAVIVLLVPVYYKNIRSLNLLSISTLLFSFYLFANSLWSIHFSTEQTLKYLRYLFTLYCLFGAIFLVQHKRPDYSILLLKSLIVIGFFHYTYGIWEHFHAFENPLAVRYSNRPIDEAIFAGVLLLACCWLMLEQKTIAYKFIYFGLSVPFIIILLLAKSRGPQLAFFLSLPLVAYCQGVSLKRFALYTGLVCLALGAVLFGTGGAEKIFSRGVHFPYRSQIWLASLHESLDYFWIGQGASHKPPLVIDDGRIFNHSHNILLSVFRMGGIVGVLLFLANIGLCLLSGFKHRNSIIGFWAVWLLFGFLCHLTNGQYPLTRPTSLWFAYWIPVFFICALVTNFKLNTQRDDSGRYSPEQVNVG